MAKSGLLISALVAILVTSINLVWGQESNQTNILVVCSVLSDDIINNLVTRGMQADAWGSPEHMRGYCYAEMLDYVENQLRAHNITLSTEHLLRNKGGQPIQSALLELHTELSVHGAPLVILRNFTEPQHLQASSMLVVHPGDQQYTTELYVMGHEEKIAAGKLATGIIFYSLDRCELAMDYFGQAENSEYTTEEGYDYSDRVVKLINFYRGNCAIISGDYENAEFYFEMASRDLNGFLDFDIESNLAWVYFQLGKKERAFRLATVMVSAAKEKDWTDSFQINAFIMRSQLYALDFQFDKAIADMDAAIALDLDNPLLYVERGQRILLLYEWDRVLADYDKAIELDPAYADAYYYRGILFYTQGPRDQASLDFERYLELAPDGEHAERAAQYIESIRAELEALGE